MIRAQEDTFNPSHDSRGHPDGHSGISKEFQREGCRDISLDFYHHRGHDHPFTTDPGGHPLLFLYWFSLGMAFKRKKGSEKDGVKEETQMGLPGYEPLTVEK